ncbi:tRNA lysidine(34) synthetase TilS [Georgenia halophila]|uniref:tRNA(Ile)-lysidine synthase n=1 Tax=Georgenia halophila TaxID=620889 RepID=A0ABP8KZ93_9MICO
MPGPDPDVAAARLAVRGALADLPAGVRVLVACSGGADSLALAAATAFVAPRQGWSAGAVVVDHRLRPGSDVAAARTARLCRHLGLEPVDVRAVDVAGGPAGTGAGGPEAAARAARYAALRGACEHHGAAAVLLGHTLDDQAETVLLGLARGSGARSLAGMPARRGPWRRPFLALRRSQTEQVCHAAGLDFERDPTNAADGPWRAADGSPLRRAAVRERALPALVDALGPGVVEALGRTSAQLTRDADLLDAQAAALLEQALVTGEPPEDQDDDAVVLDVAVLEAAHPALRTRALHAAALRAGATPGALAAVHIDTVDALVTAYHGQGPLTLPGPVSAARRCGTLAFGRP